MRENPHIMNLGRLRLMRAGGRSVQPGDISGLQRTLDLWTGVQTSRYQIAGKPLTVDTCVHPSLDMVAVRIDSPSVESGELEALLDFSCPALHNNGWVGNFDRDTGHETRVLKQSGQRVDLVRKVDAETYHASFVAGEHCSVRMPEVGVVKKKLIIRRAEYGAGDQ
jgi:hypothetical protein